MEVGEQGIDRPEAKSGLDEEPRFAAARPNAAGLGSGGLQSPHNSGAHGNDSAGALLDGANSLRRIRGNFVALGMHLVGRLGNRPRIGAKVPAPMCSVTSTMPATRRRTASSRPSEKCSPAVGAATAPGALA